MENQQQFFCNFLQLIKRRAMNCIRSCQNLCSLASFYFFMLRCNFTSFWKVVVFHDVISECIGCEWRVDASWLSSSYATCWPTSRQNHFVWCDIFLFGPGADSSFCFRLQGSFCFAIGKWQGSWNRFSLKLGGYFFYCFLLTKLLPNVTATEWF